MNLNPLVSGTDEVITEKAVKTSLENTVEQIGKGVAKEMGIQPWVLVAILIGN